MSAWKQFLASDIIVNPFVVNKGFSFPESQFATGSDGQLVGIDRFLGKNVNWFSDKSTTGTLSTEYQALIYHSAQQLYYSNFLSSSTGDNVAQPVLVPGAGPSGSGDVFIGQAQSPLYDNFLQSTLTASRYWPTGSEEQVAIFSIPSKLYGEYIVPTSFIFNYSSSLKVYDDGEGNLYSSASFSWDTGEVEYFYYSESVNFDTFISDTQITWDTSTPPSGYTFISASWQGDPGKTPFIDVASGDPVQEIDNQNVTYDDTTGQMDSDGSIYLFQNTTGDTGPAIFTWVSSSALIKSVSAGENVGNIIYPHGMAVLTNQNLPLSDISTNTNVTCSFSSSYTIYETQYKCTIRESEFNFSLNPSLLSSSEGNIYGFVTSSYFSPYVTTVGLYDELQNLLAIGKLAQPLQTSNTTDTTILINLDR
jgi:hypothetical protein